MYRNYLLANPPHFKTLVSFPFAPTYFQTVIIADKIQVAARQRTEKPGIITLKLAAART